MKILFFLFTFLGIAVVVFHSCKKDVVQTPTNEVHQTYTAEELSIWRNLTEFNNKVKSGVRDNEFISPDSALWYLEALYNVTQASNVTYDELVTDTTFYTIPINENGEVRLSDISTVYNQMLADMENTLNGFEEDYKYLILGDVYNIKVIRDSDIQMGLISGYGLKVLRFYEELDTIDNWYYGHVLGRCDGQYIWISDAGYELERRFNNIEDTYFNQPHDTAHAIDIVKRVAFAGEYSDYIYNIKWPNGDT